jgi:hypothetical protein
MLDKTIQSVSRIEQIKPETEADLTEKLRRQKILVMLAGNTGEFRLGSIRSPYIESNTRISRSVVIAMCLVSGLMAIACIAVFRLRATESKIEKVGGEMHEVMLKRGPETAFEKPAREAGKKRMPRKKTQKKRTVEV